jgi:hypothetical protein
MRVWLVLVASVGAADPKPHPIVYDPLPWSISEADAIVVLRKAKLEPKRRDSSGTSPEIDFQGKALTGYARWNPGGHLFKVHYEQLDDPGALRALVAKYGPPRTTSGLDDAAGVADWGDDELDLGVAWNFTEDLDRGRHAKIDVTFQRLK